MHCDGYRYRYRVFRKCKSVESVVKVVIRSKNSFSNGTCAPDEENLKKAQYSVDERHYPVVQQRVDHYQQMSPKRTSLIAQFDILKHFNLTKFENLQGFSLTGSSKL